MTSRPSTARRRATPRSRPGALPRPGACARLLERLDLGEVDELIGSLPERAVGLEVVPAEVKEFHKRELRRRGDEAILPAYEAWRRARGLFIGDPGLSFDRQGPRRAPAARGIWSPASTRPTL